MNKDVAKLRGVDTISGKEGYVFVTINGKRYTYMQLTEIEATLDVKAGTVETLNSAMTGHKPGTMEGKFKGKGFYVSDEMRKAWTEYKDGAGAAPYFTMQIVNNDSTSKAGRKTTTLYDCLSDSLTLAKLEAGTESLDEDISGTFDDWDLPETFKTLDGMEG
ncbi:MAG: phage tail tube protein [Eubacteriales bacterium]|jgi:hypothetical protein|nr:phage tail tube protein [Eubacteriales bacterium]